MSGAIFEPEGDRFLPAPESRARWYADALHGGPVAALLARAFEREPSPVPMMVTRMSIDLMRPVKTVPLGVTTTVIRAGKRIQVVEASLDADGVEVARATALRMRTIDLPVPSHHRRQAFPDPAAITPYEMRETEGVWFHTSAVEARFIEGDFYEPGPATVWMRLILPLVAGEEPTPLQRTTAVADFGNGLSRVLPSGWLFINPDLTVHLSRYPLGEWVGLRARTDIDDQGVGLAQSELFDEAGAIGHALQGLLVDTGAEWVD
ncbi:MAG TPA: thioesterase family protein [Acidimicrobiia bacterium]|nr:thioesterase family protein [Acidimicrobiia bacterium]